MEKKLIQRKRQGIGKSNLYSPSFPSDFSEQSFGIEEPPEIDNHLTEAPDWQTEQDGDFEIKF